MKQLILKLAVLAAGTTGFLGRGLAQPGEQATPTDLPQAGEVVVASQPAGLPELSDPEFVAALADRLAVLEAAGQEASLAGHNAWMLTASALVLFMTVPGLAMFYGGLVRRKNVLSILMQCIFLMGMMTVLWGVIGYSLAFGAGGPYLGNLDHLFMRGVAMSGGQAPMSDSIPTLTFMVFQGMFFIITPALICGAFAERMKFSAMVAFSAIWGLLIYCPLCHWVWGGGILALAKSMRWPVVPWILPGARWYISVQSRARRRTAVATPDGFGNRGHAATHRDLHGWGAGMLWVGWFGFNAGSELASDGLAAAPPSWRTHFPPGPWLGQAMNG